MPYLEQSVKEMLFEDSITPSAPGHLNYLFTMISKGYLQTKGESYQTYNDIIGALEAAKLELYRRKVASYEDLKIKANGDVY